MKPLCAINPSHPLPLTWTGGCWLCEGCTEKASDILCPTGGVDDAARLFQEAKLGAEEVQG